MISLLGCALLVWSVDPQIAWFTQPRDGRGPRVTSAPTQDRAIPPWEFRFHSGKRNEAGYAQIPIDGDRLFAHGLEAIEIEGEGRGPGTRIDVVLVTADEAYRMPLVLDRRRTTSLPIAKFKGDRGAALSPSNRIRFLRLESPREGIPRDAAFQIHALRFQLQEDTPKRAALQSEETAVLPRDRSPLYPFGVYLLGGNRSLLEEFALAGANTTVEYGPRSWPKSVVEDHLDFSRALGIWNVPVLGRERKDALLDSIDRLASLYSHPALLAVTTVDEPDGGRGRGLREEFTSPQAVERLRERVREHSAVPVLLTCLDSFGLSRYEAGGDILATDLYLPAYGPARSFADIHSAVSSVVEISARSHKVPFTVLQLDDPEWRDPADRQTPASMRAQAFGALAAGARGIFFFSGVPAIRAAHTSGDSLWKGFLDLAAEFATFAPVASNWRSIPGEPHLDSPLGEVRASAFSTEEETWIVLVNLGRAPHETRISGPLLQDAVSLVDPRDGWRARVTGGEWRGTLQALEARVLRIERGSGVARPSRMVEAHPKGEIFFASTVIGATIDPAPAETPTILLDGQFRTKLATVHKGASTVLRLVEHDLDAGSHNVRILWKDGEAERESTWTFRVQDVALPLRETFAGSTLDPKRWTPVDDVYWGTFDPQESVASGSATLENGRLHVRSTGGSFGVILRGVEAPRSFDMSWIADLPRAGKIVVQRNELLRKIDLPQGRTRVTLRERPGSQIVLAGNREVARFTPPIDHQGGAIGIGVSAGGEAFFDDFWLEPK